MSAGAISRVATRIPMATTLMRHEPIGDIPAATVNTKYNLATQNGNLPMDRFIHSLFVEVALQITIPGAAGPTVINADAPYSLIDRVVVSGFHNVRNQPETIVDMRGADLAALARLYQGVDVYATYSIAGVAQPALTIAAGDVVDTRFILPIPFVPLKVPRYLQTAYLLDAPNYSQLRLDIYWADESNLFTIGVAPAVFSAWGLAGAGNPLLKVSGLFAQEINKFRNFLPGRVWRYQYELTGSAMTTTANNTRLFNVPRGNRIRALLLKTGVKAVTTGANNAFLTLSDVILANINVYRGINKSIRRYDNFFGSSAEALYTKSVTAPIGHLLMDWSNQGTLDSALDLRGLTAGPTGDVDTYLAGDVTGVAAQAAVATWEELRGYPQSV